jgi:hypothetical protein
MCNVVAECDHSLKTPVRLCVIACCTVSCGLGFGVRALLSAVPVAQWHSGRTDGLQLVLVVY